jgi:RNA polymerase sigma-70 factor (ECF subfamily)
MTTRIKSIRARDQASSQSNVARTENPDMDDTALLPRIRAGDAHAIELMVRVHGGRMLATAKRLLKCHEDANDAVQDAFVSAFKSIGQFEGSSRLSTWLHRIVVNASLMKLRSRRCRDEVSIESLMPSFALDGHRNNPREAWIAPTQEILERQETRQMIRDKIDLLPDDYRTVLILRDIEELDTAATAQSLSVNEGAVKTRLHRARMALRQLLENELTDMPACRR